MTGTKWAMAFPLLLSVALGHPVLAQQRDPCLPDPRLTPGQAADVTAASVCELQYDNPANKVPLALKGQVFARYHIDKFELGYHVDHLIPVILGGSNSIENLWPQPLAGEWSWIRKNKLERRLRKLVCSGQLSLTQAQQEIATDWIRAYKKYVGEPDDAQSSQPWIPFFRMLLRPRW